jgi:putative aminopeptidase FrvX
MTIAFSDFINQFMSNTALMVTSILTLGVILVNGWTDAPNAIATCISTRSMSPKAAIIMAAIFNFFGVFVMTIFNATVAHTIYKMVDFGGDSHKALVALCAALFAIVLWATAAWWFGIPTSESHALIAGISGAAIALQRGIGGINLEEWIKVIYGLFLSLIMGFFVGVFTVIGLIKGNGNNRKKIMITAHIDEVALIVTSIDKNGFIKISGLNGVDPKVLLGQEVTIHGKKEVFGIIGAKPPHLLKADERKNAVKMKDLCIDTGLDGDKVKEYVSVGDVVTFNVSPLILGKNKISSKTLDNRCGIAAIIETMKEIVAMKHESDIYFIATTQEEFSMAGAITAAYNIEPDMAIVIDATHGETPDTTKENSFPLGKGPVIAIGPNMHKELTKKLIDIAKAENIPFNIEVITGDSGTEAWGIQVSKEGIPIVLISIPIRYMHTAVETAHFDDIRNAGKLTARFVTSLEKEPEVILCT